MVNLVYALSKMLRITNMKSIIWDIDGTLLDSSAGIVASFQHAVEVMQFKAKDPIDFTSFIGLMPQEAFKKYYNASAQKAQEATDYFRAFYKEKQIGNAFLYDGMINVLAEFEKRGYKQAVATNKRRDLAIEVCKHFGINKYFASIWGTDMHGTLTKTDIIMACLKDLHITDKNTVTMIGDTHIDKEAAAACGVNFLAVHYGFGNLDESYVVNTPMSILAVFDKLVDTENTIRS